MKTDYYFENNNAEICYTENYFISQMIENGIEEMEVLKADPSRFFNEAWCNEEAFVIDDSKDTCGKQCHAYTPRNGKSGCCKHYSTKLYTHGEKVILKVKP